MIIANHVIDLGEQLREGDFHLQELVILPDADLTDRQRANRAKKFLKEVDAVQAAMKELARRESRAEASRKRYRRTSVRMKWRVGRARIEVSRAIRAITFTNAIKQQFLAKIEDAASILRRAERNVERLARQAAPPARGRKKTARRPEVPGLRDARKALNERRREVGESAVQLSHIQRIHLHWLGAG